MQPQCTEGIEGVGQLCCQSAVAVWRVENDAIQEEKEPNAITSSRLYDSGTPELVSRRHQQSCVAPKIVTTKISWPSILPSERQ
jgi:hypothetical protein